MPPAAQDTIVLDGSLGLETNVSQHTGDRKSFRIYRDLVTDGGRRIVKRDGRGATLGSVAGTEIQVIHEYVHTDRSNGVETYHTLGAIDGGFFIYRWNGVTTWTGQPLPITPTSGGRWGFEDADNCVFAFNGNDALLIGEQPSFRLASLTSVTTTATGTTSVPHTFLTGDLVTISGASPAACNGIFAITVTGATTFTYVFAGGTSPATGTIVASARSVIRWRTAGVDAPTFAPTYSLLTNNPPVGSTSTGFTVTIVKGSTEVNASGAAFVTGAAWVGKAMNIDGNWYAILSVTTTSKLVLTEGAKEDSAALLVWTVYPGVGDWDDTAPQYRFSYVNPTTGHVSNPSPILQVTETAQRGRTITITIPASSENQTAYQNGYTQIQLFRTPKSAGIPVALNEKLTNVNSAVTTITYVETATKFADTYLTDFQAPLINYKPPAGITAMAFQQGRGWAIHKPTGRVIFSPVGVEVDFGRAVECWPPLFRLDLQVQPRGLFVVGGESAADSLVIQTSRGDFSVDGYNSITFSPYRLRTRKSGSYMYAAADVDGQLVEYYADNRLMVMRNDIAQKIQDKLNAVKPALIANVRLHWFAANSRNYLLLSIPKNSSSTANDYTYVFDLDLDGGPIYEWNFGISAFATVHDTTTLALQLFGGDPSGAVYRLFSGSNQDAGANFAPTLRTALFRGDELRGELKYVKLFVSDAQVTSAPTTAWTGVLYINEQTNSAATNGEATAMTFRQMDYRSQSAQGRELIWTPTVSLRTKSKVFQLDITFPNVNAALAIEQIIIGSDTEQIATNVGMPGTQA